MRIERLRVSGLRCLSDIDLGLSSGINLFIGDNGAGKTSVLEAAFLLSHAGSFRSGSKDALLQREANRLSVFAELVHADRRTARVGLGRESSRWEAKVNGESAALGQLVRQCAVVCFEPGSHALIAGGSDERRRYLDWGVFHVEHDFLSQWRRYQRALKQRNSLLRSGGLVSDELFEPWEAEIAQTAHRIDGFRRHYLDLLRPHLVASLSRLLPELGEFNLRYRRGWADEEHLNNLLPNTRSKDLARGHTTIGPHRADWSVSFEHAPLREHLSRGQEKLTAMACVLAQAQLYASCCNEWPIVCLDDLASELDQSHQAAVVSQLVDAGAQVLITGTEKPQVMHAVPARVFHVEQGQVSRLL
ncbi:DNA replication/repair protein RecF [Rhodanobacter sp. BL-MT-08]